MSFTVNSGEYMAACYFEDEEFKIKKPRSKSENRKLKFGHVEDDNVDISYLDFPVLRLSLTFTAISMVAFIAALLAAFNSDYKPMTDEELLDNSIIIRYGGKPFRCSTLLKFPIGGLPSILNMIEINVWGNVIFRFATCLTIAVRCFHIILFKHLLMKTYWKDGQNRIFNWFCDLMPMATAIETISLAMFTIITMHSDFRDINHFCKSVFAVAATVNMFIPITFLFMATMNSANIRDTIIVLIRAVCAAVFGYFAPQYFQFHIIWTKDSLCHSYIPYDYAIMEYSITISYAIFHLFFLYDLRQLQFICFPRTCGGECEPLDPKNFEKGQKYEYCRAFEYNQRRLRDSSIVRL